jgi:antitoxin Xre/MbcA/ParS-like protein
MGIQRGAQNIDRGKIRKMLIALLSHWGLSAEEQLSLLGLAQTNRAALAKYRDGRLLVNDRDKLDRAKILLGIHKSLRLLFPNNRELAYGWVSQPNQAFGGRSPIQLIDERGMMGMYMVRAYLCHQLER